MNSSEDGKRQRRVHRKSRLGCQECKRRKIKCDESLPVCLNCVRRDTECSYTLHGRHLESASFGHSPAGDSPDSSDCQQSLLSTLIDQKTQLEVMLKRLEALETEVEQLREVQHSAVLHHSEVELLRHYLLMTTNNEFQEESSHSFWRVGLLEMGFSKLHVLHLILGFAALHKARSVPEQHTLFLEKSRHYHTLGLQESTKLLQSINQENYQVVHASALLISLHNLARGPEPGQYMGFSDHGAPTFMTFIRGVKCIQKHGRKLGNGASSSSLDKSGRSCISTVERKPTSPRTEPEVHLQNLRDLITASHILPELEVKASYVAAVDQLELFFAMVYGDHNAPQPKQKPGCQAHQPLGWLYGAPELYLDYLERKEQLALVIFANFCVILKKLGLSWLLQGWPEHIMTGIWSSLHPPYRNLLRWPQEQVGGTEIENVPLAKS